MDNSQSNKRLVMVISIEKNQRFTKLIWHERVILFSNNHGHVKSYFRLELMWAHERKPTEQGCWSVAMGSIGMISIKVPSRSEGIPCGVAGWNLTIETHSQHHHLFRFCDKRCKSIWLKRPPTSYQINHTNPLQACELVLLLKFKLGATKSKRALACANATCGFIFGSKDLGSIPKHLTIQHYPTNNPNHLKSPNKTS